jgi:hypothetical protein
MRRRWRRNRSSRSRRWRRRGRSLSRGRSLRWSGSLRRGRSQRGSWWRGCGLSRSGRRGGSGDCDAAAEKQEHHREDNCGASVSHQGTPGITSQLEFPARTRKPGRISELLATL